MSTSGTFDSHCACGQPVQSTHATPVQLGTYKITHPSGVFLTSEIGPESQIIMTLEKSIHVEVVETRVEDSGCVRGRVHVMRDSNDGTTDIPMIGWVSEGVLGDWRR